MAGGPTTAGMGAVVHALDLRTNYLQAGSEDFDGKPIILLHGSGPGVSARTN
jgi:hypothetical protein